MIGQDDGCDRAAEALNEVADAADATADEQRRVAANSRQLSRERQNGASWREITENGRPRILLGLLAASARRLSEVGGSFRRALAVTLAMEGLSTRQIGERFGVSHQRVSSLLNRRSDREGSAPSAEGERTTDDSDAGRGPSSLSEK